MLATFKCNMEQSRTKYKTNTIWLLVFGSGTAESPISHLVRTAATATAAAAAARVQQILNHVIG